MNELRNHVLVTLPKALHSSYVYSHGRGMYLLSDINCILVTLNNNRASFRIILHICCPSGIVDEILWWLLSVWATFFFLSANECIANTHDKWEEARSTKLQTGGDSIVQSRKVVWNCSLLAPLHFSACIERIFSQLNMIQCIYCIKLSSCKTSNCTTGCILVSVAALTSLIRDVRHGQCHQRCVERENQPFLGWDNTLPGVEVASDGKADDI